MSLIEKTFVRKTEGNEAYRVLVNYWNCTRIQVPKILSCISQIFPHYTMHDVSHSNAILDSIERFLGPDTIDSLSVTDLWLLLCSAYCHDIGMYITGDDIQKCFDSDEFQKFVLDIKKDAKSPLHKYAVYYVLEDKKLKYEKCELSLNSYHSATYLLAEFFRKKHADRSETFMQTDKTVVQMFSEVKRLTLIVAEICRLHGADFKKVMEFYNYENGIEDYCHPRFVACMLRIGDLLDFDSSRVSRFLLEHLSFSIPEDSKIHNEKNFCIKHALVTPEKVDVLAECDINTAFEIDKWFSWIREEMSNQRNSWHDIAPTPVAKGYPMLGRLETRLLGDYDTIDNNYKPRFEIDSEKATEILQGAGLYSDKIQCIREILQNAIDATYLRIYLDNNDFASLSLEDGFKRFVELCGLDKYQIEFSCTWEDNVWHIVVQDNGIGIRKEDLKYLLKIGSGKNNKKKFEIIEKMPEYAKPSGIFGIGFQSIFLITDKVNIETRSALDNKLIKVEIGTPLKDGFAIIKTQEDPFARIGTRISFDVLENKIVGRYTSEKKYDFIEDDINNIRLARIMQEVNLVGKKSYIKIKYNKEYIKKEDNGIGRIYQNEEKDDKSSKMIMEITPLFERIGKKSRLNHDIYYRNEIIRFVDYSNEIAFIPWKVNILSESSDDILLVSRNDLKKEKIKIIIKTIIRLGIRWINENWDSVEEKFKPICAAFVEYYGEEDQKEKIKAYRDKLQVYGNSIENIVKYNSVVLRCISAESAVEKKDNQLIINDYFDLWSGVRNAEYLSYILRKYYKYGIYFKYEKFKDLDGDEIEAIVLEYEKNSDDRVDWKGWLRSYVFEYFEGERLLRSFMPCIGYEKLKINSNVKKVAVRQEPMKCFKKLNYSRTVCPYVFGGKKIEWSCSDKLYQWVYDNRFDKKVTIDEIKETFEKMKQDFSGYIKEINDEMEKKLRLVNS